MQPERRAERAALRVRGVTGESTVTAATSASGAPAAARRSAL